MMQELRFKCACMPEEVKIYVRSRGELESITDYMKNVVQTELGFAHTRLSPGCRRTEMEYAKIPIEDGKPIGSGVQHK